MIPIRNRPNGKTARLRQVFLLVAALLLVAASCYPAAARDVRVALTDLRPTIYTDGHGQPTGFFVDLLNDMAAKNGWNIIWVRGSLSDSWTRLADGEIDLMAGVSSTPERQVLYDFSNESALSVWSQVYARPGSGINTILDLDGKRVASVSGASSGIGFRDYARKFNVNVTMLETETPEETFAATARGDADALVVYNTAAQEDAVTYGLAETPVMFNPAQFGFAVKKGENADLLGVIDRYLAEGKHNPSSAYSQATHKWFGVRAGGTVPSWILWGLVAAAGVALLFVGMSVTLRRQVRKKTAELRVQNEELQLEVECRQRAETELKKKNEELHAAYEELTAAEEELRQNYADLNRSEQALLAARKRLNLLNKLTLQDIQSGIYTLTGYLQLAKGAGCSGKAQEFLEKGEGTFQEIRGSIEYAKKFQDLGINQPRWQNVNYVVISAISHLALSQISRSVALDDLEIYADPLLEHVFVTLIENVFTHGTGATEIRIYYRKKADSITILVEDNGPGIPVDLKERIFEWEYKGSGRGTPGLFLAREILSITGITITETGEPGAGARFEMTVPEREYRFGDGSAG